MRHLGTLATRVSASPCQNNLEQAARLCYTAPHDRMDAIVMKDFPSPVDDNTLRLELKTHGLRCTRPRETILGFFREADKHVSAEGLYTMLQERGANFSLSTVYLNLSVLTEAGLIREINGLEGEKLYDSNHHHHHHIICRHCQSVADVADSLQQLPSSMALPQGWQLEQREIVFYGICPACRAKESQAKESRAKEGQAETSQPDGAQHD